MSGPGELELREAAQHLVSRNLPDLQRILRQPAEPTVARYGRLQAERPRWSREQLVKTLIRRPANQSARRGGAAGGVAFLPGIGTGLSIAAVVGSTAKTLQYSIECIDT